MGISLNSVSNDINKYLNLSYIPEQYRWMVPLVLVVLGVLMLYKSNSTWKFVIGLLGLIGGYFETAKLMSSYGFTFTLFGSTIPPYVLPLIVGVLASVLLLVLIRFAISAALAYVIYYELSKYTHLAIYLIALISIISFGLSYYLYRKIVTILAKVIGAVVLFVGLMMMGLSAEYSMIITAVLLFIAAVWMIYSKKIIAAWYKWRGRESAKSSNPPTPAPTQATTQTAPVPPVKEKTKGGEKSMGIIKKALSIPKKVITAPLKLKKKSVSSDEVAPAEAQTAPETKIQEKVQVNADGTTTIIKEEVK